MGIARWQVKARRVRIQRAIKRGNTVRQIAARERMTTRTILRYCAGPKFQQQLVKYRVLQAVDDLQLAHRLKNLVKTQLTKLEANKALELNVFDMAKLNRAALDREQRAETVLAASIARGLEADDTELQAAKEYLKSRQLAKQAVVAHAQAQRLLDHPTKGATP